MNGSWWAVALLPVAVAAARHDRRPLDRIRALAGMPPRPTVVDHVRRLTAPLGGDGPLADALESVASSLRSGATVRAAVVEAASRAVGAPLRGAAARIEAGEPLAGALAGWARGGGSGPSLVAATLVLADRMGGRAAISIDGVVATLRGRSAASREALALATQARTSAILLVVAPVLFGAAAAAGDPGVARFFGSPPGLACVLVAIVLDAVGALWMRAMVRSVA